MVLSLLFGKKYAQTQIGAVFLDATISEDHQYNSRVTNYPLEDGTDITDHVILEPEIVQISGVVSDTPLSFLSSFNRSVTAFNQLIRIHQNKERVTLVTGIKIYTDMVLTSLQVPREIRTGQSLIFNMTLQKVFLDSSVRLNLDINNPFNKANDKIPREIVNESSNYPFLQSDPPLSLKDQAQTPIDLGIQNLLSVPPTILPNVINNISNYAGFV